MAGQFIPLPELAPPVPEEMTPQQGIVLWAELYDAGEQLLLAGLRRQVGPQGDVAGAYRKWNEEYLAQHDKDLFRLMDNLNRREGSRGR